MYLLKQKILNYDQIIDLLILLNSIRRGIFLFMNPYSQRQMLQFDDFIEASQQKTALITEIDELPLYRRLEKPNLNNDKLKDIKQQLQLDQKAKTSFQNRKMYGNFMFNFNANPFTQQFKNSDDILSEKIENSIKNKSKSYDDVDADTANIGENNSMQSVKKQPLGKIQSILDEVRKYRQSRHQIRQNMSGPLREMMRQKQHISSYLASGLRSKDLSKTLVIIEKREDIANQINHETKEEKMFPQAMELDQILTIKDKNFYQNQQRISNPFKFLFNPELFLLSGNTVLDSYYFCYNSMKDIIQKFKISIYRDISRCSRELMLERKLNQQKSSLLHVSETNPILNPPEFHLLLSISAGRTKPSELMRIMLENFISAPSKDDEVSTSSVNDNEIDYQKNLKNFKVLKQEELNTKYQADEFKSMPLEPKQERYRTYLAQDLFRYRKHLVKENQFLSNNIYDSNLYRSLHQEAETHINNMFQFGIPEPDKEKLIRKNKISKDRLEELKIKNLTQALKMQIQQKKTVANLRNTKLKTPVRHSLSKTPTKQFPSKTPTKQFPSKTPTKQLASKTPIKKTLSKTPIKDLSNKLNLKKIK